MCVCGEGAGVGVGAHAHVLACLWEIWFIEYHYMTA